MLMSRWRNKGPSLSLYKGIIFIEHCILPEWFFIAPGTIFGVARSERVRRAVGGRE